MFKNIPTFLGSTRGVGKTAALAAAAKSHGQGAFIVCMDQHEAKRVAQQYGVETISVTTLLRDWTSHRNPDRVIPFIEPDVLMELYAEHERSLDSMRVSLRRIEASNRSLNSALRTELERSDKWKARAETLQTNIQRHMQSIHSLWDNDQIEENTDADCPLMKGGEDLHEASGGEVDTDCICDDRQLAHRVVNGDHFSE